LEIIITIEANSYFPSLKEKEPKQIPNNNQGWDATISLDFQQKPKDKNPS